MRLNFVNRASSLPENQKNLKSCHFFPKRLLLEKQQQSNNAAETQQLFSFCSVSTSGSLTHKQLFGKLEAKQRVKALAKVRSWLPGRADRAEKARAI